MRSIRLAFHRCAEQRRLAAILSLALAATACGPGSGTYCQSGPKYGTQCYAEPDVTRSGPGTREAPDHTDGSEAPAYPPNPGQVKWK